MVISSLIKRFIKKINVSTSSRLHYSHLPSTSMASFVEKQLHLLEIEHLAEIEEKNFETANLSLKVLQRKGICIPKLVINSLETGLYDRSIVTFSLRTVNKTFPFNIFSPGDIVKLSHSGEEDASGDEFNGIVMKISNENISVAFDSLTFRDTLDNLNQYGKSVALVKVANKATYERLKQAMKDLSKYSSGPSKFLIDVLFGDASPTSSNLNDVTLYNKALNQCQQEAVRFALSQRELAVIHGPPGTGKTTTVIEIIAQLVKSGLKVLACAPSNVAVDNMLEKLSQLRVPTTRNAKEGSQLRKLKLARIGHPARILDPALQELSLDALIHRSGASHLIRDVRSDLEQIQARFRKSTEANKRNLYQERRNLTVELRKREKKAIRDILSPADVVLATNVGAYPRGPLQNLPHNHFDVVVIDECGQALEAACWVSLLRAPKCILAGDHLQLSPTIVSHDAASEGLSLTLLERLIDLHGDKVVRMLTEQYRMHRVIMNWSSERMYDGRLTAHGSIESHLLSDLPDVSDTDETRVPLLLIDTAGCDMAEAESEESDSKANEGEVGVVCKHLSSLIEAGVEPADVAVISPYNLQVDILRNIYHSKYPQLEIKSVDGFQGREKEAVILSLVRSNRDREVGFLSDQRRLNVAVTRARRHITVVCDSDTVSRDPTIKSLLDYMRDHGEVRSAYEYEDNDDNEDDRIQSVIHSFHLIYPPAKVSNPKSNHKKNFTPTSKSSKSLKSSFETKPTDNKVEVDLVDEELRETYRNIIAKYRRLFIHDLSRNLSDVLPNSDNDEHELSEALDIEVNQEKKKIDFPPSLTSSERKVIHQVCEEFALLHQSSGKGKNRKITVFFSKANEEDQNLANEDKEDYVSPTSNCDEHSNDDATLNNETHRSVEETTSQNERAVYRSEGNHEASSSSHDCFISSGENRYNELEDCVKEVTPPPPPEDKPEPGHAVCDRCGRSIPESNMRMHAMHCERMARLQSRLESDQNTSREETVRPSDGTSKRSRSKKCAKINMTGDDDEVLDRAFASSRTCCHSNCKASVATIGHQCATCRRTFCTRHSLPEVHGCGDKARASARRQIVRDGVLYPGSGVPDRKPPPDKRAVLKHRLDSKLKSKESSRKGNRKKK